MILENLITNAKNYEMVRITRENVGRYLGEICELEAADTFYNQVCGHEKTTEASVKEDVLGRPEGFPEDQKYFLCFYQEGKLMAILDYLEGYRYQDPDQEGCAWIGLLQIRKELQNTGIGQEIMFELVESAKDDGFKRIQLAVIKENKPGQNFWEKEGFEKIADSDNGKWKLNIMEKEI